MFEFDQYETGRHHEVVSRHAGRRQPPIDVAGLSFLHWGEHCIECADPQCYATCSLYRSRPDGRCRRFAYGIHRNRRYGSLRGFGAEIAFKRWGKLETEGNAFMEPARLVLQRERLIELSRPLARAFGSAATRLVGGDRWDAWPPPPRKLARRLHRKLDLSAGAGEAPDSFLVEVINPQDRPVTIQLAMRVTEADEEAAAWAPLPPPVLARLVLPVGYSHHRLDYAQFERVVAARRRFKISVTPEGDSALRLVFLSLDFVVERRRPMSRRLPFPATREIRSTGSPPPPVKCVVFDLDETLWHGVLSEGSSVALRDGVADLIRTLDRRGILVSIASKNDHGQAWRQLKWFGLTEYLVHPQIGWAPKSTGIREVAHALGIGLDAIALVDDSDFERAEVARALPMVMGVPIEGIATLRDHPRLEGSGSLDASRRRQYYQQAVIRDREKADWQGDYDGFLRSCEINLRVKRYRDADFQRIAELVQRTNQLNFSGAKYGHADLVDRLRDDCTQKYVLECDDRFGSYGTVGFALVTQAVSAVRVKDLMLSCRAQGRTIEQAFFGYLLRAMDDDGPTRLWVNFRARERNQPARRVLQQLGFRADRSGEGYELETTARTFPTSAINVIGQCRADGDTSQAGGARHVVP